MGKRSGDTNYGQGSNTRLALGGEVLVVRDGKIGSFDIYCDSARFPKSRGQPM